MVEIKENDIVSNERIEDLILKDIPEEKVSDIHFPDTRDILSISDINIQAIQTLFDKIITGDYNFDNQGKKTKSEIKNIITQYIESPISKNHILNQYINNFSTLPGWIEEIINNTYNNGEIGAHELQEYFNKNTNIIAIGKDILGPNWNGSNIDDNSSISNTCPGLFFTEEEFITAFNEKNKKRIDKNNETIKSIDLYTFTKEHLNIKKEKGVLYINNAIINEHSVLGNKSLINAVAQNTPIQIVNTSELQRLFQNIYNDETQHTLYQEIYDTTKESNENYVFHDTGLDFFAEDTLENQDTILDNFKKSIGSKDNNDILLEKNDDLQKIMEILPINKDDKPDTKHEKKRLIYLLNHGLFRGFQLAINSLNQCGVNCCNSSPYLCQNNDTYNKLLNHLNRYQTEKKEDFYQLIDNISNLNVDLSSSLFEGTSTKAHLRISQRRENIMNVVNLAKSYFIQKIKDNQTPNRNIETFKNQLAYMLSTMERESGYQYSAHTNKYGGYGQIKYGYTGLRTLFSQGSGLDFGIKDGHGNEVKGQDIKFTKSSFTEEKFSTFAFVYGMIYGHLSNRGSLDTYINDGNVDNPDFWNARNIEAGANNQHYPNTAKLWKKVIDESSNIS